MLGTMRLLSAYSMMNVMVTTAALPHTTPRTALGRTSEVKFLRSFLTAEAEQQERRRVALQSELEKNDRRAAAPAALTDPSAEQSMMEQKRNKEHEKQVRRAAAVPQKLAELALQERQVRALALSLDGGNCDTSGVRRCICAELDLAAKLESFVPPTEWGRPEGFSGLVFESPRGVPILVCHKRAEGDDAMRRIGQGSDLWFQVRSGHGARVLLRTSMVRGLKGSRECVACASQLAAYYSDERYEEQVEVGYTDSRHVARSNAARAGRMRDSKRINALWVRPAGAEAIVEAHAEGRSFAYDQSDDGGGMGEDLSMGVTAAATAAAAATAPVPSPSTLSFTVPPRVKPTVKARVTKKSGGAPAARGSPQPAQQRGPKGGQQGGLQGGQPRPRSGRATRRQRLEEADLESVRERLAEAGVDRRGGWRATKAKAHRRNRRYESRLLQSFDLDDLKEE